MSTFQGKRVNHEFTQMNDGSPAKVFPLLCPVREADWVPGWKHQLVYSESGFAEDGCVFFTPNGAGPETVWMVTRYEPEALTIAYAWVQPGMIATQLHISLAPAPAGQTRAHIRYLYTGLSPAGNEALERYTPEWFQNKMRHWEAAINHYLRTGGIISAEGWE